MKLNNKSVKRLKYLILNFDTEINSILFLFNCIPVYLYAHLKNNKKKFFLIYNSFDSFKCILSVNINLFSALSSEDCSFNLIDLSLLIPISISEFQEELVTMQFMRQNND